MRVYLCDDNRSHRVLVRTVLSGEPDLEVVGEAAQGLDCVEGARELQPDVVLVDNRMPGLEGIDLLERLHEALPDAKLVMLSTAWSAEVEREALRRGATAYVQKPRNVFDLPSLVRGAVGQAGALVEQLLRNWLRGERERAYAAMHHDVEFRPLLAPDVVRGVAEMKRYHAMAPAATITPEVLLEHGSDVLLVAHVEMDGSDSLELASLIKVRNGKVASIRTFGDRADAEAAAGFGEDSPRVARRPVAGWRLMAQLGLTVRPPSTGRLAAVT